MATFTTFDAPTGVAVGSGGRQATAADFGPAEGMKALGASLGQASSIIRQREDKRSITQARAQYAEFEIQQEQVTADRQQNAGVGAPGYFDQTKTDYDTAFKDMSAGWNDVQKGALAERVSSGRTASLKGAIRHQSSAIVKADIGYMKTIGKGISRRLANGEINFAQATQEYSEMLVDTTIGADKQDELAVAAQPMFRTTLSDSLIANPDLGLQMLRAGDLSMYPPEELTKLKEDMVKSMLNAGEKAKQVRFVNDISNSAAAMSALINGDMTPAQLEQEFSGKLPPETLGTLKEMVSKQQRPFRTPEEQLVATSDLRARYNELGIKRTKGKMTTTGTLRELLRFQTDALKLVNAGYVNAGAISVYNRDIEAVTQKLISEALPGPVAGTLDWWGNTPFNHGNKKISDHVKTGGLGTAAHTGVARRFNALLDENNIQPGDPMTTELEAKIDGLVDAAIVGDIRERVPATRNMTDVPNFILNNGGRVAGAPGQRDIKADIKIETNLQIGIDDKTGQYWLRTVDKAGKDLAPAQPITQDQALGKSPMPAPANATSPDTKNPTASTPEVQPAPQATPNASAPANATSPDTNPDPLISSHDLTSKNPTASTPEFQSEIATQIEDELFAIEEGGAPDQDPDPLRVSMELTLPPAEQAIDIVQKGLVAVEGTGDDLTGIATGEGGITETRKADIERRKGRPLTDQQARNEAVREDSTALHDGMPGFATLGAEVQAAVVDLAFNVGVNSVLDPVEFKQLRTAIAAGDEAQILANTLDTALVGGKSVKGLALRRARMYNQASKGLQITDVEQLSDGTINYLSGMVVIYTFKRPRHDKSAAGKTPVTDGAE